MRDTSASYSRGCLALIMSALGNLRTEDAQIQVIQAITAPRRYVFHSADAASSHESPAYAKDRDCTAGTSLMNFLHTKNTLAIIRVWRVRFFLV